MCLLSAVHCLLSLAFTDESGDSGQTGIRDEISSVQKHRKIAPAGQTHGRRTGGGREGERGGSRRTDNDEKGGGEEEASEGGREEQKNEYGHLTM